MKTAQSVKAIEEIMAQAQVYASAWSLVGSRIDEGDELANAQEQKAALRALVERAVLEPVFIGFDMATGPDMSVEIQLPLGRVEG
ncbi:hypothetical protein [Variovorax sp.]|uniref:hypothetical protein n=1 Tax=Variovorax sp. TaxID=1871043 RepID=UPI003BAC02EF